MGRPGLTADTGHWAAPGAERTAHTLVCVNAELQEILALVGGTASLFNVYFEFLAEVLQALSRSPDPVVALRNIQSHLDQGDAWLAELLVSASSPLRPVILESLRKMKPHIRKAFLLHASNECITWEEVRQELQLDQSVGTIKVAVSRARSKMRQSIIE